MRYMLDTNTVSHLIRRQTPVVDRVVAMPASDLCISSITAGELAFGLARRPEAVQLRRAVEELLKRLEVLPWGGAAAATLGAMRAGLEARGRSLGALDLLIAAHAASAGLILVSNDQAFALVDDLALQDWSA